MHLYVTILITVLATCHAFVPDAVNVQETRGYGAYAGEKGLLVDFLEKFKETLRKGDKKLGIPVLDPLKANQLNLNIHEEETVSLEGYLKNIRAIGLSDYKVIRGDFHIVGLIANVSLLFNEIDVMTEYNVNGTLMDQILLYGHGNIALFIKGLSVSVNLKLGTESQKIVVRDLVLNVHVKTFDLKMSGLFNDEDLSNTLSHAISEILPGLLDDYQNELSARASPIVANLLNKFLKNFTLKDLLDIINGQHR
ncbi:hypothetical protein QLX08_009534 [Tetragonisca angustula]|uniref:Uncharacterized protein n=1 Tax=Tetragonisca angustula TaxID=166442 RepID=A0AAW0ZI65_9HYME